MYRSLLHFVVLVLKLLNPYQGLKRFLPDAVSITLKVLKPLNPYQGLKPG